MHPLTLVFFSLLIFIAASVYNLAYESCSSKAHMCNLGDNGFYKVAEKCINQCTTSAVLHLDDNHVPQYKCVQIQNKSDCSQPTGYDVCWNIHRNEDVHVNGEAGGQVAQEESRPVSHKYICDRSDAGATIPSSLFAHQRFPEATISFNRSPLLTSSKPSRPLPASSQEECHLRIELERRRPWGPIRKRFAFRRSCPYVHQSDPYISCQKSVMTIRKNDEQAICSMDITSPCKLDGKLSYCPTKPDNNTKVERAVNNVCKHNLWTKLLNDRRCTMTSSGKRKCGCKRSIKPVCCALQNGRNVTRRNYCYCESLSCSNGHVLYGKRCTNTNSCLNTCNLTDAWNEMCCASKRGVFRTGNECSCKRCHQGVIIKQGRCPRCKCTDAVKPVQCRIRRMVLVTRENPCLCRCVGGKVVGPARR